MRKLVRFALKKLGVTADVIIVKEDLKGNLAALQPHKTFYELKIDKKRIKKRGELLEEVIFHECVHIYQSECRGFIHTEEGTLFDGEKYEPKTEEDYWWSPWEVEARGLEQALLHSWSMRNEEPNKLYIGRYQEARSL